VAFPGKRPVAQYLLVPQFFRDMVAGASQKPRQRRMAKKQVEQQQQSAPKNQRRFRMRPIEVSDAETIADWYQQIEDVSIFDRQMPLPINNTEVVTLIKSLVADQEKEKCRWFIAETMEGKTVGMAGLELINMLHGNAIMPVFIAEPWRRSGVGIRMAGMVIDFAFKQLRLHRVATVYRDDNAASNELVSRLGFKTEGTSRQSWFSHGQYFDLRNVGLLVDEWEQTRLKLRAELSPDISVELGPRPSVVWSWPGRN
jgi:RimJ/RimL family protein N-acetyltransferase